MNDKYFFDTCGLFSKAALVRVLKTIQSNVENLNCKHLELSLKVEEVD